MNDLLFLNLRPIEAEGLAALMAAKNSGYNVILMSNNCPEYASPYLKSYVKIDNKDEEACIKQAQTIAENNDVKAVFSWNDTDIILSAKIAEILKLNHVLVDAAIVAKNKFLCRERLSDKLPHLLPKFAKIEASSPVDEVVKGFTYPLILKPVSASGSQGIFLIHNRQELLYALEQLEHKRKNEAKGLFDKFGAYYIVEEFLHGQEVSIEGFVSNNVVYIAGITDKTTTNPWYIETRHIFPSKLPATTQEKIIIAVESIVRELGIHHAAIHVEMKVQKDECKLVEIATRTGGDLICSHLVSEALNISWLEIIIKSTINGKIDDQFIEVKKQGPQRVAGVQFYIASQEGIFNGLSVNAEIPNTIELMKRGSSIVLPPKSFNQCRVGYSLTKNINYEAVESELNKAIQLTNINLS